MKFTNNVVLPEADYANVCAGIVSGWDVSVNDQTLTFIATLFNAVVDHGASTIVTSNHVKVKIMTFEEETTGPNDIKHEFIDFTGVEISIKNWFIGMCDSFALKPDMVGFRKLIHIGSLLKQTDRFRAALEYSYMNDKTKYAGHEAREKFATNIVEYDELIESIEGKRSTLRVDIEKLRRETEIMELRSRARAVKINGA